MRSVPRLAPPAPTAGSGKAVLPPPQSALPEAPATAGDSQGRVEANNVPSTSGMVGSKASPQETGPRRRTGRSLERVSNASSEAMDTTPSQTAQAAPKERRASLDRSKKEKTPITGPEKAL